MLAALTLASCATAPPSTLAPERSAAAFRARSLNDPGLRDLAARAGLPAWPPERLDGRALTLTAVQNGEAVRLARAKLRLTEAAVRTAGERPNPSFTFNPVYVTNVAAGLSPWLLSAALVQLIDTAGKRPLRVEKARFDAEAARYELVAAARDTAQRIEALLLDLSAFRSRLAALDEQVAAQTGLTEAAEKRLRVGLGSSLELASTRATLRRSVLDRQTTAATQADTLHQLAVLVGVPVEQLALNRLSLPALDRTLPSGFVDRVRAAAPLNRADLLARLAEYGATDAELRLQRAGRTPNIEVGPSFEYDQGARKWGLTLTSTLPIFNRQGGAIAEALAQRRRAEEQFTSAQAGVIGETERAAEAYRQAVQALAVAERLYADQIKRARATEALFLRGEIDRVELLTARAELAAQLTSRTDALGAVARATLAVEAAGQLRADGFDPAGLLSSGQGEQ